MADSPAKRHHSRVLAELEAAQRAPHQLMAGATAYEQHMAQLQSDRLRLKQIQSTQGKAALKAQLLSLALFSVRHGFRVAAGDADLSALIEVNTSIMAGLRGRAAE